MGKKKTILDLSQLERFTKLEDQEFKMTKIGSKREGSQVGVGQYETGDFSLMEINHPSVPVGSVGGFITGRGFGYLRTSPIVKIVDSDDISTTFETEGGIYKLQMWPRPRASLKPVICEKCGTISEMKDLDMKMGGLLCPTCRVILFQPYVDKEYFHERNRRDSEARAEERAADKAEKDSSGDGQEGT